MAKSDEELLDFDKDRLADWNPNRAAEAMQGAHGDIYRNHLAIAQWIDGWAERLEEGEFREDPSKFNEGFLHGIRDIAAHLRQTDLLPEGVLLHEDGL